MTAERFDLVLRNARVATASDTFDADIAIRGGRIVQLGTGLAAGAREIDAAGRVVTPGGVDAHCHLDQPMAPPVRMADDFDSGTRSAACGGTTTVIPFAAQEKGQSLRAAVARARAGQRHAAPRGGPHALRRPAPARLAGADDRARRGALGRSGLPGAPHARAVPQVRRTFAVAAHEPESRMRLLLINPNISDSVSEIIRAEAQRNASSGTEIEVLTAPGLAALLDAGARRRDA